MNHALRIALAMTAVGSAIAGCGQDATTPTTNVDGSKYLLAAEPEGARGVIDARKNAKDGEDIVLVGRIGGSPDPWVAGRAAFSIVDASVKSCTEQGCDCPKPWDFC